MIILIIINNSLNFLEEQNIVIVLFKSIKIIFIGLHERLSPVNFFNNFFLNFFDHWCNVFKMLNLIIL